MPLVRDDLGLTYAQIGLLSTIPAFIATFIEPALGIAADVWRRRALVLSGGVAFVVACATVASARGYLWLLAGWIVFYPASGAFVSVSQASLMDADPRRREHNMARWVVAGTVGNIAGPLLVAASVAAGGGWRTAFAAIAALTFLALIRITRFPFHAPAPREHVAVVDALLGVLRSVRRRDVLGRLVLLEVSDLMLDILTAFLALYLVDRAGLTAPQAALVLGARAAAGLLGELGVTAILERVAGVRLMRWTVLAAAALYPAFLLAPSPVAKAVLAPILGFATAGWYAILKARLYAALPDRSGSVIALGNVTGLPWSFVPAGLGLVADRFGITATMWLLWAGPLVLLGWVSRARADA